jgi:elongator complex protein 2
MYLFVINFFSEPGSEDYLVQNSLWPETMKLYGHGYEVFSLASSHSGRVVASSCKATTPEHARIILWDSQTWEKLQELEGHQLTVTQMAFSPDDNHLLSVSRDRTWCLFGKNGIIIILFIFTSKP